MIIIDKVKVDEEILTEKFVCDLSKCKGGCCVDGDTGAPLTSQELDEIDNAYPIVEKYLTPEAIAKIHSVGKYHTDDEFGMVTPDINGGICVYAYKDENETVLCAFEKAYRAGETQWKKPISCHLYPIITTKEDLYELMEYYPRKKMCAPACKNGKALGVKVYEFLKEPIVRKYGIDFYIALERIDKMRQK
jgi:hypothetical protein